MAAYIPVPRDLTRVKTKVLFNLTKRQLVCFGIGSVIGVPLFFAVKSFASVSTAVMCMMAAMLPAFLFGTYERDGQALEAVAWQFMQAKFIRPKDRPYETDNYYSALARQARAEKEITDIVLEYEKNKAGKAGKGGRPAEGGAEKDRRRNPPRKEG